MLKNIIADVVLKPVSFPEQIEVSYLEIDPLTDRRTNVRYTELDLHSLEWCKQHILVSIYKWREHEEALARGETIAVVRGPSSFELEEAE